MRQSSSRVRTGQSSRPPAGHRSISTAVPEEHSSNDFKTPPPPSRRLRSHSSRAGLAPSPLSISRSTGLGIDVALVQPSSRTRPAAQRRTTVPLGKAKTAAAATPQTSRLPSSGEVRYRREQISERQPGSRSVAAGMPRRQRVRCASGGATSARPLPITSALPAASQPSLNFLSVSSTSEAEGLNTHHALQSRLRSTDDSAGEAVGLHTSPEAVPASVASHTPLYGREGVAASTSRVALGDSTPMNGRASGTASYAFPRTLSSMNSSPIRTSSEATPTLVSTAPLQKSMPILGLHSKSASGQQDEDHPVGDPSVLRQPSRPVATHELPVSTASSWNPPIPPIAIQRRSIPSVASITGSSHCSTLTEAAVTPPTVSCLNWSTAGSTTDFSGCSPTTHTKSLASGLRSVNALSLTVLDGTHHEASATPAPRAAENDGGAPELVGPHSLGTRVLSHNPVVADTRGAALTLASHAVPEAVPIGHAPEQHLQRPTLPLPAHVVKSSAPLQRVSPSSAAAYGAPLRSKLTREGLMGGGAARGTLVGCGDTAPAFCSPNPTRPPRCVTKSSERNGPQTPATTASVPGNAAAVPPTKSPAEMLAEELARRALKERRRRELYAWNEQLRSQDECSVQDAV
ncbi:hypothetical protein LSCM1_07904 [Leishmania martiniquensis]|uniref:Uncharacterized protein n=1 Tax=Leishmania martiniquensis TaxID=1580590 RepID=A0A836HXV4_9TRYP|nr:hypothetical protein LSCM1_07904 [Leishmania martiniquensis]